MTLYHWDLPQPLQDGGGWTNRETVDRFGEYADAITRALGDRVKNWFTINEPWVASMLSNYLGVMAPGHRDLAEALAVGHNLMRGHGRGVEIVRANVPRGRVGLVVNSTAARPASDSDEDRAAARRFDGWMTRWFLDPAAGKGYPADMVQLYGSSAPDVVTSDLESIAAPTDFLALNYYFPAYVKNTPGNPVLGFAPVDTIAGERTATGWLVEPKGLTDLLVRVQNDYDFGPLFVTENGAAFNDPAPTTA